MVCIPALCSFPVSLENLRNIKLPNEEPSILGVIHMPWTRHSERHGNKWAFLLLQHWLFLAYNLSPCPTLWVLSSILGFVYTYSQIPWISRHSSHPPEHTDHRCPAVCTIQFTYLYHSILEVQIHIMPCESWYIGWWVLRGQDSCLMKVRLSA